MLSTGLTIFAFYAGLCGLILLALSVLVVRARVTTETIIGDAGKEAMIRATRAHANASEYVPISLILLGALVALETPVWLLHTLGASLVVARLLHAAGLHQTSGTSFGRFTGTILQWLVLLAGSALALYLSLA